MTESEEKPGKSREKQFAPVKRTLTQRLFYFLVRLASQFVAVFIFEFRCFGRENIPGPGGGLILSTHQSTVDPVMVGLSFNERLNYLARKSLFDNGIFATVIRLLDAIELDRKRGGLAGLKEAMKRLKRGEKVLIFPEGTRSSDGRVAPVKPGFVSLAQRTHTPLLPVAITGAFDVLPRTSRLPRRYPVRVAIGPLISNADLEGKTEHEILALVQQRLLRADAVARGHAR
jgi:1-acyl-sn-glycerol-3-phosphate acyltransferase